MAVKSGKDVDPFYDRLESLIELVLDNAPDATALQKLATLKPEAYASMIGALYRARDGKMPEGGNRQAVSAMSDSQLEDALVMMMRERGYEIKAPPAVHSNVYSMPDRKVEDAG